MVPLRGWAPRGERLKAKVPHRRWKTMTFLAALRLDRVEAPWLIDGPINGERFRLYVKKVLLPTLRPDDLVVIDNLGSHRGKAIRRIIRSVGAKLSSCRNTRPISIDRAAVRQAETLAAQRRRSLRRCRVQCYRPHPRHRHNRRMRQLLRQCRV